MSCHSKNSVHHALHIYALTDNNPQVTHSIFVLITVTVYSWSRQSTTVIATRPAHFLGKTQVCTNDYYRYELRFTSHQSLPQTITTDNARLDIRARGFWSATQDAYFDVRVYHPNAPSNSSKTIKAAYKKHEDKKRAYGQCVRDIEQRVFTPLVF